ncbi:MAG: YceD family protein [Clostridium celatum]|nr:YceD family protein [Clostridium celatum]
MKWTIKEIRDYPEDILSFNVDLKLAKSLKAIRQDIIDVDYVQVQGYISDLKQEIILHGNVDARLVLPSSRSLRPVSVDLKLPLRERYVYPGHEGNLEDYEETTITLGSDEIDLDQAVVDLLALNVPMKVLAEDESDQDLPRGKDWKVLTEDQYIQQSIEEKANSVDPRLEKLKALLEEEDN